MTGIFGPSGGFIDEPLLDGEEIVRQQAANLLFHGVNWVPGQLVLTNKRLLFKPLNLGGLNKAVQLGLTLLPGGGGAIIGALIGAADILQSGKKGAVPIAQIESVVVGKRKANPIHPASLLVNLKNGRTLEIAVYTSLATAAFLPQHAVVRDKMLQQITGYLR